MDIVPYVDTFLFDYKETVASKHLQYTGADNKDILQNFDLICKLNKDVILRCPIISGLNDRTDHLSAIAELLTRWKISGK